MRLGVVLRAWRQERGLTIREVASSMGVSHPTLSRIENGKGVNTEVLLKIMHWLSCEEPKIKCTGELNRVESV